MTTETLSPLVRYAFLDNNGNPASAYQLFTYQSGTQVKTPTYVDSTGLNANTNPVILDNRGECDLWIPPNTSFTYCFAPPNDTDPPSNPIWTRNNIQNVQVVLTQSTIGQALWPQTTAEVNAGVTPSNYAYPPGDIRRYGAVLDGVTVDTGAVAQWASIGGQLTWPVSQLALIDQTISLPSETTINFAEGGGLTLATNDIAFLSASSETNINIYGGLFVQTTFGSGGQYLIGGIVFDTCTNCVVEGCKFVGMQWSGILIKGNSVYCTLSSNYFSAALGALQDAADIAIIANANGAPAFCIVNGNFCYGGSGYGISCWNPYSGTSMPARNVISYNKIGFHTGYGILIYSGLATADSFNQVIGNEIEGITGSALWNTSSGAGIYCVGAACGGTLISENIVRNCCISTANATLAPAGIGLNGTGGSSMPLIVTSNEVEGMTQYHGILATGCQGGMTISDNVVRMPASNTTGDGIRITNSDSVAVTGNTVAQLNTTTNQRCIMFFAQGAGMSGCSCVGNTITGGHLSQIECQQTGSNIVTGITIADNNCVGGDNNCIPLLLNSTAVARAMVSGNYCTSGTNPAVQQTACTNIRYSNNYFLSNGTVDASFLGLNTNGLYDETNTGQSTDASINNAGTGMIVIQRTGSTAPASGTYAAGDTRWFLTPAAAAAPGAVCTTAGSPGVWKTMAVLAS